MDAATSGGDPIVIEDCTCANEEDVCVNGQCTRDGVDCNSDECPDSYTCTQFPGDTTRWCTCFGERADCGPFCDVEGDCPDGLDCDVDRGVCEPPHDCGGTIYHCPSGQTCEYGGTCELVGDGAEGSSCDANPDCTSGICLSGTCEEPCLVDADCEASEYCGIDALGLPATCKPRPDSCPDCPDGTRCVPEEGACEASFCKTTVDCGSVDCVHTRGQIGPGTCEPADQRNCKPHEWTVRGTDLCFTNTPCNDVTDCSLPYECSHGWCAREASF